ncbi:MAG TPA: hypothetical protein VKV03_09100 [Candidatus Binataceae bacterium]|nr:hypothetical protein [Candidatus Binataceae bacterium]
MKLKYFIKFLILISLCAPPASAWAHGVVGDYVFLEPLIAGDPTPANELDVVEPGWTRTADGRAFSIGTEIEKVIATDSEGLPRLSIGGGTNWSYQSPKQGPPDNGFDDLEVFGKYAFLFVPSHEFLMSLELDASIPTGNPKIEEQQHTSVGPSLNWEKALGDLPNYPMLKYLRPFGFQGNFAYLPALGGHTSHEMSANQVVEYSLSYLSNNVQEIGLKPPFRNLFLFTEFNYDQLVKGPSGETFPKIMMTPGIAYVGYHFELSIGTQLALNNAARPDNHAVVLGLLDIFYDSIIPQGNWTLNDLWR